MLILEVIGPNISLFLKKVHNLQINTKIIKQEKEKIIIKINYDDYFKLMQNKTIYQIRVIRKTGLLKLENELSKRKIIIFSFILTLIFISIYSSLIIDVNIFHDKQEIKTNLTKDLKKYGISPFHFRKSYEELKEIKSKLEKLPYVEWVEFEVNGTTYNIKIEERIENKKTNEKKLNNYVALKNAVIKEQNLSHGETLKGIGSYVQKGELIALNAQGTIIGEVWYQVKSEIDLIQTTKKTIKKYTFKPLPNCKILKNYGPLKQVKCEKTIKYPITTEEARIMAIEQAINEITNDKEKIIFQKQLKQTYKDSKIEVEMFFTVLEDITGIEEHLEELNKEWVYVWNI